MEEILFDDDLPQYPKTSTREIQSKNTLQYLLSPKYIKGELRVLDKYPGIDGILEITNDNQNPIGKIEVQLKTLDKKDCNSPKFQCDKQFLSYCSKSSLPVFLIAVDNENKIAYWEHINRELLQDISQKIKGKSYSVKFPKNQYIDGNNLDYIYSWTEICNQLNYKINNFDNLKIQHQLLENEITELKKHLLPKINLSEKDIKEIHIFLDFYNYLLDKEFKIIKKVLYPEYWKIGIGVVKYEDEECSFILFPVSYENNEPLIKQIKTDGSYDLSKSFVEGSALSLNSFFSLNKIKMEPESLAYTLIKSNFDKELNRFQFPINNTFAAEEYIISFVNSFHNLLGLDINLEKYKLVDLQYRLKILLPVILEIRLNLPDEIENFTYDIDSLSKLKSSNQDKTIIEKAIKLTDDYFVSKLNLKLNSKIYNIEILYYYLDFLEENGYTDCCRIYRTDKNSQFQYSYVWDQWEKESLIANFNNFFTNFLSIYNSFVNQYFSEIKNILTFFDEFDTIIYVITYKPNDRFGLQLEYYKLKSKSTSFYTNSVHFYSSDDPECPFERKKFVDRKNWNLTFLGKRFSVVQIGGVSPNFIFDRIPSYTFLSGIITKKIDAYLTKKIKSQE